MQATADNARLTTEMPLEATDIGENALTALVEKSGRVETLPTVARKIMRMTESETTSAADLQRLLERDPALTSQLLKIANSPFYGLRGQVSNLRQAVIILGFAKLRSLVIAASLRSINKRTGPIELRLWEHAVGVAVASSLIGARLGMRDRDTLFLGGLLHDLGRMIMNNEFPRLFRQVLEAEDAAESSVPRIEREAFGFDHAALGGEVTRRWLLPPAFASLIANHHAWELDPAFRASEPALDAQLAVLNLADHLCDHMGIGHPTPRATDDLAVLKASRALHLAPSVLDSVIDEIGERYEAELNVFM